MTNEERKDAIAKLNTVAHYGLDLEQSDLVDDVIGLLEREQVSVTPTREHGEWIHAKVGRLFPSNDFKCSKCGNILDFDGVNCGRGDANFCPNCGADMRKEQK